MLVTTEHLFTLFTYVCILVLSPFALRMNCGGWPEPTPRSYRVLEQARRSSRGYDSNATREALTKAVRATFNQNSPRDFQVDVAEALILGLDVTLVAGTGSGKTLPWAMPLLLDGNEERHCLVISPLKALQVDHVSCQEIWQTQH